MTTASKQRKGKPSEIQLSGHPSLRRHHLLHNLSEESIKLYLYFRAQRETPFAFYGKTLLFKKKKYKTIHFNTKCVLECTIFCTQCTICVLESTTDRCGPKLKKSYKLLIRITIQSCMPHSKKWVKLCFHQNTWNQTSLIINTLLRGTTRVNIRTWFLRWKAYMIFEFVSGHLQLDNTTNEKNMNQLYAYVK